MRIVYSGGVGIDTPYKYSQIKTKDQFDSFRRVYEMDNETGEKVFVGLDECSVEWDLEDINYIAGEKIRSVYPEYKQLNILRSGIQTDIDKMNTFIDLVRTWANSENPDPWDGTLDSIP